MLDKFELLSNFDIRQKRFFSDTKPPIAALDVGP